MTTILPLLFNSNSSGPGSNVLLDVLNIPNNVEDEYLEQNPVLDEDQFQEVGNLWMGDITDDDALVANMNGMGMDVDWR